LAEDDLAEVDLADDEEIVVDDEREIRAVILSKVGI
jgi:hypothetical protein